MDNERRRPRIRRNDINNIPEDDRLPLPPFHLDPLHTFVCERPRSHTSAYKRPC